jgi:hypothetical protein
MMESRKPITEADLLIFLKEGRLRFPPLEVEPLGTITDDTTNELAQILTLRWQDRTYRFSVEIRRLWTPKAVSEATEMTRRIAGLSGYYPLVLVPYLSEERLLQLQEQGVSGIDLCGNGIVVVPNELFVLRTGFPNQFRWEGTIKNIYRKNSSIVARVFLLIPKFDSVNAVLEEIRKRGGEVTLATVSKVCKSLEDDLIIERPRGPLSSRAQAIVEKLPRAQETVEKVRPRPARLLQPEKLLDLLAENYALPTVSRTFQGKCKLPPNQLRMRFQGCAESSGGRIIQTGVSSTEAYAVMAREPVQSLYCSDLDGALKSLGNDIRETDRFANVSLLETQDDFVYFDLRPGLTASPIQTYLELVTGDKRDRETAEQVRKVILGPLKKESRMGS